MWYLINAAHETTSTAQPQGKGVTWKSFVLGVLSPAHPKEPGSHERNITVLQPSAGCRFQVQVLHQEKKEITGLTATEQESFRGSPTTSNTRMLLLT